MEITVNSDLALDAGALAKHMGSQHYDLIEKIAGKEQYAIEYGPILLALVGKEPGVIDEKGNTSLPVGAQDIAKRLRPKSGAPLHFTIDGASKHEYIPYWQLGDELFTCYPVLGA